VSIGERRGRYYITRYFTSDDGAGPAEKMECGTGREIRLLREGPPVYADGNMDEPIILRFVEEEVSYMADYEMNDRQEIESVRYDPVPVTRQEEVWILNRKETFPDT